MAKVVANSTRHLPAQEVEAIIAYLRTLEAEDSEPSLLKPDSDRLGTGEHLYTTQCGSGHLPTGLGDPQTGPRLKANTVAMASDPSTMINAILYGPNPPEPLVNGNPRPSMPAFEDELRDDEIASIATYVRWSWITTHRQLMKPWLGHKDRRRRRSMNR